MVASANPFVEAKTKKQPAKAIERDVGIRGTAQNLCEERVTLSHGRSLPKALARGDRQALAELPLSEREFRHVVWPELPAGNGWTAGKV